MSQKFKFSHNIIPLILLLFWGGGCAWNYEVAYTPSANQPRIFNEKPGRIHIAPFEDTRARPDEVDLTGFIGAGHSFSTNKPPKDILHEGFKKELTQRGLVLVNDISDSIG